MKKLISLLAVFAILISLCACGGNPAQNTEGSGAATDATTEATEATEGNSAGITALTPEQLYGHINQLEPMDGVYKIWSDVGVQNMANHPDAKFELLCNVDMGGATVKPIGTAEKPFTGEIKGANFTISNFTVQGGEETDFGFVGVNQGSIESLIIDNVTFIPGPNAKNIAGLAGSNAGLLTGCTVNGTMAVEEAAEDAACGAAVGTNSGTVTVVITDVDIAYTAPGAATVGGIVGVTNGGMVEYSEANGKIDITGSNKIAGLLAGSAKDAEVKNCAFVGESNTVDNILFDAYFGVQENVTGSVWLRRDNGREPEKPHIQEKREKAAQYMKDMAAVEWRVREDFEHSCNCAIAACFGTFDDGYTYYGPPYTHKSSSLARMLYCIDEEGYIKDFVLEHGGYDGYDAYIGSDCSAATVLALQTVGAEVCFTQTQDESPIYGQGTYPVGSYEYDIGLDLTSEAWITDNYIEHNGMEVMYESYAMIRLADAVVYWMPGGGHSRLCTSDAVVVRDENGAIDGNYSYVLMTEQGAVNNDNVNMVYSSWNVDKKFTFDNLYKGYYIPVTIKEFITGEFEDPVSELVDGLTNSRLGLTTGTVTSNYAMDYLTMVITDEAGNEVFNHVLFPSVSRHSVDGSNHAYNRTPIKKYDLINFAPALQEITFENGASYHATITTTLMTGDSIVVQDFTFTNG